MLSIDRHPPRRTLRQFAVLQVVFFGIVAAWLHHRFGLVALPSVVAAISAIAGIVGYYRPGFMRYVWIGWMTAVWPIGWAIAHFVLAAIFYLILTPIGLTMKLLGHDPLRRSFNRDASSYWIRRDPSSDPDRYFRQF